MPMDIPPPATLDTMLATQLREARLDITGRWLTRLVARVDLPPNLVFPTDDLLDHMPLLIDGIADHLEHRDQPITAASPIVARAMELGALRYNQGFDQYEILKEFEILGGILFRFLTIAVRQTPTAFPPDAVLECTNRVFQAVVAVQQAALAHFLQLVRARLTERENRLRAFNRALTHEFRNRMGAAMGAGRVLELPDVSAEDRAKLGAVIIRNIDSMRIVLENLLELSEIDGDTRQQRHVRLPEAINEAILGLRDMAAMRGVAIRVVGDLPSIEVPAAAVELSLTNLIANAIKYSDLGTSDRWVSVSAALVASVGGEPATMSLRVQDNGIGVPIDQRDRLFTRLFRADNAQASDNEGTGLGLSIVRETINALGGHVSAEFPDIGSAFVVTLPCRRTSDGATAQATR